MTELTLSQGTATDAEVAFVAERLGEYNESHVGPSDRSSLHILLRGPGGAVEGGVLGDVSRGWLFVRILWLAEEHRGAGHGQRLLRAAEDEARLRGCRAVWLDTFSFQAPAFYAAQGYREFGRLDDCPPGHTRHFLWKPLTG